VVMGTLFAMILNRKGGNQPSAGQLSALYRISTESRKQTG
jgi:hypothetical protein